MRVVLSGINITSGGMLSVYKDCLSELVKNYSKYDIIALVSKKELFTDYTDSIRLIEFPHAKKSWWLRCFYEYIYFYKLSQKLDADVWISMHDMSPNVVAKVRCVYCHNPSPFFKMHWSEIFIDWKVTLFCVFYKYLYAVNIHKNKYVIVQQEWLRRSFRDLYKLNNIIVAHPNIDGALLSKNCEKKYTFFYPTYPQMYKNIEVIGEALKILNRKNVNLTVYITIDGSENLYSRRIVSKYRKIGGMQFIGLQPREKVMDYYDKIDGLIFPSRLETWGMPLSEFRVSGKKIIAADLPYARESLDGYENAVFFQPDNAMALADILEGYIVKGIFSPRQIPSNKPNPPYAKNWQELFSILFNE